MCFILAKALGSFQKPWDIWETWSFSHILYYFQVELLERVEIFHMHARCAGAKDIEPVNYDELELMFDEPEPLEKDELWLRWQQTVKKSKQRKIPKFIPFQKRKQ